MIKHWFKEIKIRIEDNHNTIIITFFVILLLIGLGIFKDYGIGGDEGGP